MSDHISVSRRDASVEIAISRTAKKNALTGDMYAALADAMLEADSDPEVRSILLYGEGSAFTAGNDLQDFASNPPGPDSPVLRFLAALDSVRIPLIAAVHGPVVGVGATLLLHCDYVVAADDAQLRFPFVNLALIPEAASSLLLPRAVGYLKAAEILLTGDPVPAGRALELGLVSVVVAEGEHVARARDFADVMATKPPEAVRATKQLLKDDSAGVAKRMTDEAQLFSERLQSPEFVEAVTAFLQKRPPDFSATTPRV